MDKFSYKYLDFHNKLTHLMQDFEYKAYHIPGAVLAPIDTLPEVIDELDKDATWVVVCEHGVRSKAAHAFLTMQGFHHVINMVGGMCRWSGEVERGS